MAIAMKAPAAALALGLAYACLLPAQAQQPTPEASASSEAAKLTAARNLLVATHAEAQFAAMIPLIFRQLRQVLSAQSPDRQGEINQVFDEVLKQSIDRRSEIIDQIAHLYATRFTAEEMNTVADFYRSPVGQKFIAAMPSLAADAMKMGSAWGEQVGREAEQKIRDELRKRGLKL